MKVMKGMRQRIAESRVKIISEEEMLMGGLVMKAVFRTNNRRLTSVVQSIIIPKDFLERQKRTVGKDNPLRRGGGLQVFKSLP